VVDIILLSCLVTWPGLTIAGQGDTGLGLPSYPQARDSRFTGVIETNQVPLDALVVTTKDGIDTVMDFYRKELKKMDVTWAEHWFSPQSGYIGFYDRTSGTMRLVTTMAMPSGGTMLVFSSMDPRPLLEKPATVPEDLPSLPGAEEIVTTETSEGGERQRSVRYVLPDSSPDVARKQLVDTAGKLGWKSYKGKQKVADNMLLFLRGRDRCIVSVTPRKGKDKKGSAVLMIANDKRPGAKQ
jgi:hypothetical protein